MALGKKSKSGNKGKNRNKAGSNNVKTWHLEPELEEVTCDETDFAALEQKISFVRAFWDTLSEAERTDSLTLDVLRIDRWTIAVAADARNAGILTLLEAFLFHRQCLLVDIVKEGISRLATKSTRHSWKVWRWPNVVQEFMTQRSFRSYVQQYHLDDEQLKVLLKAQDMQSTAADLRVRMLKLHREAREGQLHTLDTLDTLDIDAVDYITMVLAAYEEEHHYLYNMIMTPIVRLVCQALPKAKRKTTATDLHYCDLEKLSTDLLQCIRQWLYMAGLVFSHVTGVELLHAWHADGGSEAGHVDLDKFRLDPSDMTKLQLDPIWSCCLQGNRQNGYKLFRKGSSDAADEQKDFTIDWIYRKVRPAADSCRAWAQTSLGSWSPTVDYAHAQLVSALNDMQAWQLRIDDSKKLLHDMLASRRDIAELGTKYDLRPRLDREMNMHPCELPDHVVVALLKREALLNRVRLHAVQIQHIISNERLRHLQTKQCQGEPKFERWKAELEAPFKTPHTMATAKQLPRTHAGVATDHVDLANNFETLGATLREFESEERRVVGEIEIQLEEVKQYAGWAENLLNMATTLEEVAQAGLPPMAEGLQEGSSCPCCNTSTCSSIEWGHTVALRIRQAQADQLRQTAAMLKQAFQTDVRHQLHEDKKEHKLYQLLQTQLLQIERRQQEGCAVLPFMEACLLNLACDDPGVIIGTHVLLPLLQKQLLAKAQDFHNQKAAHDHLEAARQQETAATLAGQELLAEEEQEQAKAAAKRAKKQKAKSRKQQSQEQQQQRHEQEPDESEPSETFFTDSLAIHDSDSASTQLDLSAQHMVRNAGTTGRDTAHAESPEGHDAVSPDLIVSDKLQSELQVCAEPSVSAKSSSSSNGSLHSCKGDQQLQDLFLCPITQVLMVDPVIAADGHTYERSAMHSWLQHHQTSPVTGAALAHVKLVPNVVIRGVIQQQLI